MSGNTEQPTAAREAMTARAEALAELVGDFRRRVRSCTELLETQGALSGTDVYRVQGKRTAYSNAVSLTEAALARATQPQAPVSRQGGVEAAARAAIAAVRREQPRGDLGFLQPLEDALSAAPEPEEAGRGEAVGAGDAEALQWMRQLLGDLDMARLPTKPDVVMLCGRAAGRVADSLRALIPALATSEQKGAE